MSKEFAADLESQWARTTELVRKSPLLHPSMAQSTGAGAIDPHAKALAAAKELVQKSAIPMTPEQAYRQVLEQDPSIYEDYLDVNPAQRAKTR